MGLITERFGKTLKYGRPMLPVGSLKLESSGWPGLVQIAVFVVPDAGGVGAHVGYVQNPGSREFTLDR